MATQQTLVGMGGEEPALYDFGSGTVTWTSNSRHGRSGPSLGNIRNGLSGGNSNSWKNDTNYLNESSGICFWTVPQNGTYRITTYGPRGSNQYSTWFGGYGTQMRGDFDLQSGEVLKILVGQTGADGYGGGGGMTGVAQNNNTPLIFSGGGNCTSPWSGSVHNATTSTTGVQGGNSSGGSGGNCGYSNSGTWGGAGFYQNYSGNANCGNYPYSFTNNGLGGYTCNGQGGYGGGTGTDGCCYGSSGAGGGYSGGGGGTPSGGGGGSYNNGSNQSNTQNGSNWGSVTIQKLT